MNGATLRAIRTRCGYTLDHFASLVDVTGRTLSRWELDPRDVPADVAKTAYRAHNEYLEAIEQVDEDAAADGVVYVARKDDPAPHGYTRIVWNSAAGDYALDEGYPLMWLGDDQENDEESEQ